MDNNIIKTKGLNLVKVIVLSALSVVVFSSLYIPATMNALSESYIAGISAFKVPFYISRNCLFLVLVVMLFSGLWVLKRFKNIQNIYSELGLLIIVMSLSVIGLAFFPCLYNHSHPHTFTSMLKQSLFCPSYSVRSYVWPVLYLIVGSVLWLQGRSYRKCYSH